VLRIGVISAYPEEDWHARRIAEAAASRHRVDILGPTDFAAEVRSGAPRVTVRGLDSAAWDLFLTPRALGDDGDPDVQLELYRVLARSGARMVNEVDALLVAIDKFRTSFELARAGIPTPEAMVVQTREQADFAFDRMHDLVVKPVYGSLGIGIEHIRERDRLHERLADRGALYLQRYVGDARLDVRAFVVGDRVEAAIAREPRPGEFRGNLQLGATARLVDLDDAAVDVAVRATRALGLDYSGVDLLVGPRGPEVIEVNGTPAFRGVWEATGRDMAPAIVAHAITHVSPTENDEWRRAT
jgi:tetrahydromethanopterin:alpha-L-glutamate ligase